jgi:acetyl-CoA synthetase
MYARSIDDPAGFWGEIASQFYWKTPPAKDRFFQFNFDPTVGPVKIEWMAGAVTNVCYNVLDRHVADGLGDKVAFYWEGNDPEDFNEITYSELLKQVCKFANILKSKGIQKGDRVAIYMPMIVETVVAMLACARLGVIHSIVFGGYSMDALAARILDSKASALIIADGVWRGEKLLNLKQIADGAMVICAESGHKVPACIVVRHLSPSVEDIVHGASGDLNEEDTYRPIGKRPVRRLEIHWDDNRDTWWHLEMAKASSECEPEWLDAEEPLFMLYTSGSTGKAKGVLHTQAGYLLYAATTFKYVFDYQEDDVYWCTADLGWITGHTYVCYGPLANGATSVMFEGTPFYPDVSRYWAVIDKYNVTKFYTAPTAIRSLMKFGDSFVTKYKRQSLKVLGSVGEPINPEAWLWYHEIVGNRRCAVVDTFWQTETGGHVITPLPGATPTKPGSATFPFFGVVPELLSEDGRVIEGEGEGYLVFKQPWPGMMRTVFGSHERFETTYFKKFPGYYTTGDGAKRDADGYLWITGRIDDMLNVSGHLLSTADVESVLIEHPLVAETAVVAHPHAVKGECLYCFITLKDGHTFTSELKTSLMNKVRQKIGPFAQPDFMQEAPSLPKTRSGKIMRRVLRKIAVGDHSLGDISTMADESVVDLLFSLRPTNA